MIDHRRVAGVKTTLCQWTWYRKSLDVLFRCTTREFRCYFLSWRLVNSQQDMINSKCLKRVTSESQYNPFPHSSTPYGSLRPFPHLAFIHRWRHRDNPFERSSVRLINNIESGPGINTLEESTPLHVLNMKFAYTLMISLLFTVAFGHPISHPVRMHALMHLKSE